MALKDIRDALALAEKIDNLLDTQKSVITDLFLSYWGEDFKKDLLENDIPLPSCDQVGGDGFCMFYEKNKDGFSNSVSVVPVDFLIDILSKKRKITQDDFYSNAI